MVRRFWRTGLRELAGAASPRVLVRDARRYLPALPETQGDATLRQLMNHTSCYRCYLDLASLGEGPAIKPRGEALAAQLARDLLFRKFCRLEIDRGTPDATTIGRFRAVLEAEERLERERLEAEERARIEKERLEAEEEARLELERRKAEEEARLEHKRVEAEQLEKLERAKADARREAEVDRLAAEQLQAEAREQAKLLTETPVAGESDSIRVDLMADANHRYLWSATCAIICGR